MGFQEQTQPQTAGTQFSGQPAAQQAPPPPTSNPVVDPAQFQGTDHVPPIDVPPLDPSFQATAQPGQQNFSPNAQLDPFDSARLSGPFSAPFTGGQLDALSGFQQMFTGQPVAHTQDLRNTLETALGGFGPGAAPPQFDNTPAFAAQEQAFNADLDQRLAQIREESSALGLGPGSTDRERRLADSAGTSLARFRVGQTDQARQSFESGQQRRNDVLGMLPQFRNQSFQEARGLFDINERARGVADMDIQRRLAEVVRGQGGQLNQLLSLFSNTPLTNTEFGPSGLSQVGGILGAIARLPFLPGGG